MPANGCVGSIKNQLGMNRVKPKSERKQSYGCTRQGLVTRKMWTEHQCVGMVWWTGTDNFFKLFNLVQS